MKPAIPFGDLRALGEGEPAPGLALATRLEVDDALAAWWDTRDGQLGRWRALQSPLLSSLRTLRAAGVQSAAVDDTFAHQLAAAPHLRALRDVELSCCGLGPESCDALASSALMSSLRSLDLSLNPLGDEGATRLARADAPTALRALDLSCVLLGDDAAVALATSTALPSLQRLSLRGNHISAHGYDALERSPRVPFETTPYVTASREDLSRPDPAWSRAILRAAPSRPMSGGYAWRYVCEEIELLGVDPRWLEDAWPCLERTSAGASTWPRAITRAALERVAQGLHAPTIERCDTLDLRELPADDTHAMNRATLERVLSLPHSRNITTITGSHVRWLDDDAALVIADRAPPTLSSLRITSCNVGDRFAAALADAENLRGLTHLDLTDNQLTQRGLGHLAAHAKMPKLQTVRLSTYGQARQAAEAAALALTP